METDDYHRNRKRKQAFYRNPKTSDRNFCKSTFQRTEGTGDERFYHQKIKNGYPVSIEYELLPYSQTLEEVVGAMTKWGMQHSEKVKTESRHKKAPNI